MFSDETDPSCKHPEFTATHLQSGVVVDVEAKSRHRSGVLGYHGTEQSLAEITLGIHRKLNEAVEKAGDRPLIVFFGC
jgi:hypothetical protein